MKNQTGSKPLYIRHCLITLLITLIGNFLYAVGLNLFFVPHQFLAGGLAGIAMISFYLTGIPIGITNLVLNIPLLGLSLRYMGKFYTILTIISTIALSVFIDLTSGLAAPILIKNPLVSAIAGGVIIGIGNGILYRFDSNSGGLDVIGAILKKYYNLDIGYVVFALNFLIVGVSAIIFSLEPAVCTLIGMYLTATMSNRVVIGFAQRKAAFIVSDKPLEITDAILREIGHGATLLEGQGGFSGDKKHIIFAIVDLLQISKLHLIIHEIDPAAFLFIMNTTDVIGRGFTKPLHTDSHPIKSSRYTIAKDGTLIPTKIWEYEMNCEANPSMEEMQSPPKIDNK